MEHASISSAAAGMTTMVVPEERRLPEAGLNGIILRWAFIDKAISGFGALALDRLGHHRSAWWILHPDKAEGFFVRHNHLLPRSHEVRDMRS